MYTFMDDYGNEWGITTDNPVFMHHYWIEFSGENDNTHEIVNDHCVREGYIPCHAGNNRGVTWSSIMAPSSEETENSCYWQFELLTEELNKILFPIYDIEDDEKYRIALSAWEDLRMDKWTEFYQKYPEHHMAQAWLEKAKSNAN